MDKQEFIDRATADLDLEQTNPEYYSVFFAKLITLGCPFKDAATITLSKTKREGGAIDFQHIYLIYANPLLASQFPVTPNVGDVKRCLNEIGGSDNIFRHLITIYTMLQYPKNIEDFKKIFIDCRKNFINIAEG
jgi:hypothetical protein